MMLFMTGVASVTPGQAHEYALPCKPGKPAPAGYVLYSWEKRAPRNSLPVPNNMANPKTWIYEKKKELHLEKEKEQGLLLSFKRQNGRGWETDVGESMVKMQGDPSTTHPNVLKVQMSQLSSPLSPSVLWKLPYLVEVGSSSCKMPQLLICLNGDPASLIRQSPSLYFSAPALGLVIPDST